MDQANDQTVVRHDEVATMLLEFLYEQFHCGVYAGSFRGPLRKRYPGQASWVTHSVMRQVTKKLRTEGRIRGGWPYGWVQLTASQWLRMTSAKVQGVNRESSDVATEGA